MRVLKDGYVCLCYVYENDNLHWRLWMQSNGNKKKLEKNLQSNIQYYVMSVWMKCVFCIFIYIVLMQYTDMSEYVIFQISRKTASHFFKSLNKTKIVHISRVNVLLFENKYRNKQKKKENTTNKWKKEQKKCELKSTWYLLNLILRSLIKFHCCQLQWIHAYII